LKWSWIKVLLELMNYLDFKIIKSKILEEIKDKGSLSQGE
jgi:hypothetical protein